MSEEASRAHLPQKAEAARMLHHKRINKLLLTALLTSDVLHKSQIPANDTVSGKKGIRAT